MEPVAETAFDPYICRDSDCRRIYWFMIHQSKKDIETARQLALEQKGKKADAVVGPGQK